MKDTDIVEMLRNKLKVPVGRHLYAVLGSYKDLATFSKRLEEAKTIDGVPFPKTVSVNQGILKSIPDEEFKSLTLNEAKKPKPTAAHVEMAFNKFVKEELKKNLIILSNLELVFTYNLDLNILRTLTTDDHRIILLLPGKRQGDKVIMFPFLKDDSRSYALPLNLISDDHIWEVKY